MLEDIVVDTNVFMHASNPQEERREASLRFLNSLQKSRTVLCLDPTHSVDTASSSSRIQAEYIQFIQDQSVGAHVLSVLFASKRTKDVPTRVSQRDKKIIEDAIHDRSDHVFARVGVNSGGRTLVSHDIKNFPGNVRRRLRKEVGLSVLEAAEVAW